MAAAPMSRSEPLECSEIMLHSCYQTAEKGFVSERQALPCNRISAALSCSACKPVTPEEGVPAGPQGPQRPQVCRAGVRSMGAGLEPGRPL